jgi:hypothetical protein
MHLVPKRSKNFMFLSFQRRNHTNSNMNSAITVKRKRMFSCHMGNKTHSHLFIEQTLVENWKFLTSRWRQKKTECHNMGTKKLASYKRKEFKTRFHEIFAQIFGKYVEQIFGSRIFQRQFNSNQSILNWTVKY